MSTTRTHSFSGFHGLLVLLAAVVTMLALSPAPAGASGTGTISGTVTDTANNPVAGVCVEAFASNDNSSGDETDANGEYSLGFVESRDYKILFSRCTGDANVFDEWYNDKPTREEATPVAGTDGADTSGIDAQLAIGGSISGTVTNGAGGSKKGTCVTAYGGAHGWAGATETDADGNFKVGGLESGTYKLGFERCNDFANLVSEYYPDKANLDEATAISVTAGADTPGINAELEPGGTITGIYSIESPVAPVFCNGSASLYDSSGNQVRHRSYGPGTGVHERYRFDRLKTGDYRVGFQFNCMGELDFGLTYGSTDFYRGKGTLAAATPVHVTGGSVRTGINSLQNGGASISGTVTDSSGSPLNNICVDSYDDQGNLGNFGRTGPDGVYVIDQFTAGEYRLKFSECLNPDPTLVPEFYDDKASLAEAAPVSLTELQDVSGIDAQLATVPVDPGQPGARKASIGKVSVNGPAKVKKGKKATYTVKITNSGDANATGVKIAVKGKGVTAKTTVGKIPAGTTKTIKVKLKPTKKGKAKLTFKATSSNAGAKTIERRITVRR